MLFASAVFSFSSTRKRYENIQNCSALRANVRTAVKFRKLPFDCRYEPEVIKCRGEQTLLLVVKRLIFLKLFPPLFLPIINPILSRMGFASTCLSSQAKSKL